ncbi:THUMP domain-containing protein [uncultured Dokdonia sp.]|uniref:THUMP domain-containing class I SAM-dependent RNA methyltransferase n=1 Tax=uncultured Dokdonia sp. TaxID=575653 RepID=UPI0026199C26|nr:THUMP domain-containing protein [uncultured Dokdonia sp.]
MSERNQNFRMVAKTFFGFEKILANELRNLGAGNVEIGVRNVSFDGDKGFMYKANLCCRTAIKILKPIAEFRVMNEDDLYRRVQRMNLRSFLSVDRTFAINATVSGDTFTHSQYAAFKVKDAIVDKFRKEEKVRPNVDTKYPDVRLNVHIQNNWCTISLDSSGASLHHRGYRTKTNIAPINEALAAGLILMSGWEGQSDLLDPMCGSATMLIEAAMIAANVPANLNRKEFAFEKWDDWDPDLYDLIEASALKKVKDFNYKIIGYDKAPSVISKARDNIKNAQLEDFITIKEQNFFDSKKEGNDFLQLVFNPPYGERLPIAMEAFYAEIGDTLKSSYPGSHAWFITSNMEALKHVGLRPSRKIKLYNGSLESRFVKYEMYEGSRKTKHQES